VAEADESGGGRTAGSVAGAAARILGPRSVRTLHNAADALVPPGADGSPGAGDVDLSPHVERSLRHQGPGAARRLVTLLGCLEWQPLLTLRARRSFSALPRARRQELLRRWEHSRLRSRRQALAALRRVVEEGLAERNQSSPGA